MNQPNTRRAPLPRRQIAGCVVGAALLAAPPAHAYPDRTEDATPAPAEWIRIASWNLNGVHRHTGSAIFRWTPARTHRDYETLADYARRLNADVIAFQEVNGPRAAERIFPPRSYSLFFSGRYDPRYDDIYTGFAVRKERFDPDKVVKRNYAALSLKVNSQWDSKLRWGVDLEIRRQGRTLRLLNVHLKAGCSKQKSLSSKRCRTLASQIKPLKRWIDERWREGTPFVVLGDFNRVLFDRDGERDHLWDAIDDREPPGLRLHRLPLPPEGGRTRPCWRGTKERYHRYPIDFFVFGDRAWQWVNKASFHEQPWDREDEKPEPGLPSDHCPIRVDLF